MGSCASTGMKKLLNKVVPAPVRWAVFVIFVFLWFLWFAGYFGW